ncbi:hypothetical protein R1sor_003375 [Riccia sorocarpa]|uniref:Red chlorophyll catabolite reductase n=1 Tax=Riccia sorocarpa TaxID=122646 RepID=A0ABD3H1E2_9MARC
MEAILTASAVIPSAVHDRTTISCRIQRWNRGVCVSRGTECLEVVGFREKVCLPSRISVRRCGLARAVVHRAGIVNLTVGRVAEEGTPFPFLSNAGRKVMTNVSTILEKELSPLLQHSKIPDDVRHFKSEDGTAEGSVVIRAGKDSSQIDFVLESWLHATLPFGTLDIATFAVMLGPETDSPHFLFEFIQSGPSLVVVLDHLPRKDLVLDTDYRQRFYEAPGLDEIRKRFEEAPNSKPYISSVLFIRSVVSPTAVLYKLNAGTQVDGGGLEEQIETVVYPGSQKMIEAWIESFLTRGSSVSNVEDTLRRDKKIKTFAIEVDLAANLPRLFGQSIADRIVEAFRTEGRIKV